MSKKAKINTKTLYRKLDRLLNESTTLDLKSQKRWAIFSDLHMGDGGSTDDFKRNSDLFATALKDFYLEKNHALILNGDVEELQRFQLKKMG